MMYLNSIPDTGAVFCFGKSYLNISDEESDQNYFFIKRDPVKKLVCGKTQSAVICESGRLFVFGDNTMGQFGLGTSEIIITKPSCVKELKKISTIKDFQFGKSFSVALTDANEIYYSGKNIFIFHTKIKSLEYFKKRQIATIPLKLSEFDELSDTFSELKAGDEHFVVLNSTRRILYIWAMDLTRPSIFYRTETNEGYIKFVECGSKSTVILTEPNDLHLSGKFGCVSISVCTKISNPINEIIREIHVSETDEVYLTTDSGKVYKSNKFKKINELKFEELKHIKPKIDKVTTGLNFITLLTFNNRCLSSLESDKMNLIESKKLKNLDVVDINSGSAHIIVSVVPKGKCKKIKTEEVFTINFDTIKEPEDQENCDVPVEIVNGSTEGFRNDDDTHQISTNLSRATTSEFRSEESTSNGDDNIEEVRFIDNGVDVTENIAFECNENHTTNNTVDSDDDVQTNTTLNDSDYSLEDLKEHNQKNAELSESDYNDNKTEKPQVIENVKLKEYGKLKKFLICGSSNTVLSPDEEAQLTKTCNLM